jgi:hypothetical protein
MFYSHQLLARKAPLGQIWCASSPALPPPAAPLAAAATDFPFFLSFFRVCFRDFPRNVWFRFFFFCVCADASLDPLQRGVPLVRRRRRPPIRPPTDPRVFPVSRRMAATLHAKINRKRLDKLDIIKIW